MAIQEKNKTYIITPLVFLKTEYEFFKNFIFGTIETIFVLNNLAVLLLYMFNVNRH